MEGRRRITLYDRMTAGETSSRDSLAGLILDDAVLADRESEAAAGSRQLGRSRTLLDIIREDEHDSNTKDRKSWKAFKDKLRLRRAGGSAWASTVHIQASNNDNNNRPLAQFSRRNSVRLQTSPDASTQHLTHQPQNDVVDGNPDSQAPTDGTFAGGESSDEDNNPETGRALSASEAAAAEEAGPVSMSLMDLLEETDREMGLEGSRYRMSDDDDDDDGGGDEHVDECGENEGDENGEGGGVVEYNCCVCMVRHKGAAFIPCGHTFCRMCSRELWVSRGNCPLCNNFILEILDIF